MTRFFSFVRLMRIHQWVKNVLVFIPLFFAGVFDDSGAVVLSILTFFAFSFASSSVYVFNDLMDVPRDRLHPTKKKRALASGVVGEGEASILLFVLLVGSMGFSFFIHQALFWVVSFYIFLHVAYALWLKHLLFIDVLTVAFGYVLRVVAGAVVLAVPVSEWMVVLIFLLALFSAIIKRRQEIRFLDRQSAKTRKVLSFYSVELLDQVNSVIVPVILMAYILYTFKAKIHSVFMLATIPLVLYAFLRFLYLVHRTDFGLSSSDYKKDAGLIVVGGLWAMLTFLALLEY